MEQMSALRQLIRFQTIGKLDLIWSFGVPLSQPRIFTAPSENTVDLWASLGLVTTVLRMTVSLSECEDPPAQSANVGWA